MIVYHGSPHLFESFSYDKISDSNGTSEGYGFYFTDDLTVAESYAEKTGYVYTIEFLGKKPLSSNKRELTRVQVKKLVESIGSQYLENYGDIESDGYNNLLNQAVRDLLTCDSDVDIVCSIINAGGITYEKMFKLINQLFGYDCIITQWTNGTNIYIATLHESYKILDVRKLENCN